jgi:hypothetical protein
MMDKTGNVLAMMFQDKMRQNQPQNMLAQKELEYMNQNPNYLTDRYKNAQTRDKLQVERDLMDWATKSLNYIDPAEYPQFRETAIKYGLNPAVLPEGFESPQAFEEFKVKVNVGAPEYAKMMQGQPVTMSKLTDDSLISTVEAKNRQEAAEYAKTGYQLGKLSGSPVRPDKPQYKHIPVYNNEGRIVAYKSVQADQDVEFGEGYFGSEPESGDKTPTPSQALKRITDIQKTRATLNKEDKVTQMLVAMNPAMKDMLGQQIPDELKQQLNDAFDAEIEYLRQFTGAKNEGETSNLPENLTQSMLNAYKQKYPDKTEDEIINAWKKRTQQ